MIRLILVFSLIVHQCCYGYPVEEPLPGTSIQNATSFIPTISSSDTALMNDTTAYNDTTAFNDTHQGFAKKVVSKVKVGISKVKTKINNIKTKIGTGVDGGGTTYYRRPYRPPTSYGRGGGNMDMTVLWVLLGVTVVGVMGTILYFMVRR